VSFVTVDNTRLYYRLEGNAGAPVLVMSHSLGTDHGMWDPQVAGLLPHFQILRCDTRGHGASDAPPGDYSIERLARDVLGLVDALKISSFAFCGLSMGGAIGQWLATHAPERMTALVLANTSSRFDGAFLEARRQAVLKDGIAPIIEIAMQRFFLPETLARCDAHAGSVRSALLAMSPVGYAGCCAAIRDVDHAALLPKICVPALIVIGDRDLSTPWSGHGEILAARIPGAQVVRLPAAHLSNIDQPRSFNAALFAFLQPIGTAPADPLDTGMRIRKQVLGDGYVERAVSDSTDFSREFQSLITRYAWGTIWARPGLDHRTRRMLVLAMTSAQGRWEEFRLHLRASLAHGMEACDIKEVLLQTAIYAGVPAANTGFQIAQEEIEKP
jgi:3-oxoadipate enol-lactonase/4-carboxymuconolactone decarboxylase